MDYTKLKSYAIASIGDIVPLDKETCGEIVNYAISLPSNNEIESHFLNLLGESEATFNFITKFMHLKQEIDEQTQSKIKKTNSKYEKSNKIDHNAPRSSTSPSSSTGDKSKNAWQKTSTKQDSPKPTKGRLDKKKSTTTSELIDLKPSNQQSLLTKKVKKKNIDNLKDIDSALTDLEISFSDADLNSSDYVKRVCNCMATRHPLFDIAPNCLNCGKIICTKEGLQPCSFCGKHLLSFEDRREIIDILQAEKNDLEYKQNNKHKKIQDHESQDANRPKSRKIKVSVRPGENLWVAQDRALKEAELERKKIQDILEKEQKDQEQIKEQEQELKQYERAHDINPDLLKAQDRLETLLNFQDTGAERTKIIDRASDYEMPSSNSLSNWLSPVERALHLKKQQKQLRKHESDEKERSGRGKKIVEMVIRDGKVHMVEKYSSAAQGKDIEDEEIQKLEDTLKDTKRKNEQTMSKNIWDYEEDRSKWEKPVYFVKDESHIPTESGSTSLKDNFNQSKKGRVQLYGTKNEDELVIAMPS